MATKKNPFEEKPYSESSALPDTRQSKANVPAAITPTEKPPAYNYRPQVYNKKTKQVEDIKRTGTVLTRSDALGTDFGPNFGKIPLTSGQEVINKVQQQQQLQQNPALQQLNQLNTNVDFQDPLSQDILTNLQGQSELQAGLNYEGTGQENLLNNSKFLASKVLQYTVTPATKILNKISGGARLGDAFADAITSNEETQKIVLGYSTGRNVKEIRENLVLSENLQTFALEQAKSNPVQAALNYEESQNLKYKSLMQMKLISRNDPDQFIELRAEIRALEMYFDGKKGIKAMNDDAMRMALYTE